MKKYYKFIFMALFGLFIFLPKDTFAQTEVRLLRGDYSVVAKCFDYDCVSGNFYVETGGIKRIMIIQDNYSIPSDMKYSWFLDFSLSYTPSQLAAMGVRIGNNGTWLTPNWSYEIKDSYFDPKWGSPTYRYHINSTFTTVNYGDSIYTDIDLGEDIWVYNFTLYNWKLTATGTGTGDIIFNQTQEIINNANKNTHEIINSNEEIKQEQEKTNQKLDELNDNLTSEDAPNLDSLNDSAGWLPAGPVDSILNLPLSLFQNLTDNLSKSCQPVIATLPYVDKTITLPCISTLYEQIGVQDFLNWVGIVVGALILYNYFLKLYQWVDDTLTFRENNWQDWGGV